MAFAPYSNRWPRPPIISELFSSQEAPVMVHQQRFLDLPEEVEHDADDDEESASAQERLDQVLHADGPREKTGQERDGRKASRAAERDAPEDPVEVLGRPLAGPDP